MTSTKDQIKNTFLEFVAATNISGTVAAFNSLLELTNSKSLRGLTLFRELQRTVHPTLPFRIAKLFQQIAERVAVHSTNSDNLTQPIVIIGAGPVGLRAAVEASLNGFESILVVEQRNDFSRLNVIKTWPITLDDLVAFGLKIYVPSQQLHGFTYCGTRDIQTTLLKTALLLGVQFRFEHRVVGVSEIDAHWHAIVVPMPPRTDTAKHDLLSFSYGRASAEGLQRTSMVNFIEPASGEQALMSSDAVAQLRQSFTVETVRVDVLISAEGEKSALLSNLGFARSVTRYASAVGLVINVKRGEGADGKAAVGVTSMAAADWNSSEQSALVRLASVGVKCENVEHLVSSEARFFVCTVMKESLVSRGVFKEDPENGARIVISRDNINTDTLWALARDVVASFGFENAEFSDHNPVQLFDFSAKGQLVDKARAFGNLLVLPVGDALQNPFWPQGLGVNKGFHSAIDAISAALVYVEHGTQRAIQEQEFLHLARNYTAFFQSFLTLPAPKWTASVTTRYSRDLFRKMHMDAVELRKPTPLSDALLQHFGWKSNKE